MIHAEGAGGQAYDAAMLQASLHSSAGLAADLSNEFHHRSSTDSQFAESRVGSLGPVSEIETISRAKAILALLVALSS